MTAVAPRAEVPVAPLPGLGRLVATELLKLRTTRVWWGLLLTGILLAFLNSGLLAATAGLSLGNGRPSPPPTDPAMLRFVYTGGLANSYSITLCLGVLGMAGEYRHQTITPTLLAVPAGAGWSSRSWSRTCSRVWPTASSSWRSAPSWGP